jgi:hypothetical protein
MSPYRSLAASKNLKHNPKNQLSSNEASVMKNPHCVILYVEPIPLTLEKIAETIQGKIIDHCFLAPGLRIDELGKIQCWAESKKEAEEAALDILAKIEKASGQMQPIAIGSRSQKGKMSVFVSSLKQVTKILAREVELLIYDLGLHSEKTRELAEVVANEILCDIVVKNTVDAGSMFLHFSKTFSGWFVVNEELRQKMVNTYLRKSTEIFSILKTNKSPLLKRLTQTIGNRKEDIAAAIIVGLVAEAILRVIVYLSEIMHAPGKEKDIKELGLPSSLLNMIQSKKAVSLAEAAKASGMEEMVVAATLNTLAGIWVVRLVNADERIYQGTGVTTYSPPPAVTTFFRGDETLMSVVFYVSCGIRFDKHEELDWKPESDLKELYHRIFKDD